MKKLYFLTLIFLILTQCFNAYAESLLSESDKIDFRLKMKEYACKIYYPDLRNTDPSLFKRDMENLQKNIVDKISKYPAYYREYIEFLNNNPSFSAAFISFSKSIQQKNKFEMLENQNKFTSYSLPKTNNFRNQKYIPTLAEKMLFKYKFNSNYKDMRVGITKGNPETTQKYQKILQEFQQINDFETLKQKGPWVIAQSEEILTRNGEDLEYADQIDNLVLISGLCYVRLRLSSAWDGTDAPDIMKQVVKYIETVYDQAKVIRYKYYIGLTISKVNEGMGLYGEAFNFCFKMKNELIEKLSWDEKTDLLWKMASELAPKCPKDEIYMELGVSCYRLYIQEIDNDPNSEPQSKVIKKLQTLLYGVVEIYEIYEKYMKAIEVINEVISYPDCPDFIKSDAEAKKKILQELVKIKINVKFGNKFMGNDGWKVIDKPYKYIGAYTGDNIRLKVELETPPGVQINFDSINWYGENISSEDQQTTVSYETPGQREINLEVVIFDKKITKIVKVYFRSKPTGKSDEAFVFGDYDNTKIAISKKLITWPSAVNQLEPFKWSEETYKNNGPHNGIQDAARHAYWSCLLRRYCGEKYAVGITKGHEVNTSPDLFTEVIMDLHNNDQGRQIANHTHNVEDDNKCCQSATINAIDNGQTFYLDDLTNSKNALLLPTNKK